MFGHIRGRLSSVNESRTRLHGCSASWLMSTKPHGAQMQLVAHACSAYYSSAGCKTSGSRHLPLNQGYRRDQDKPDKMSDGRPDIMVGPRRTTGTAPHVVPCSVQPVPHRLLGASELIIKRLKMATEDVQLLIFSRGGRVNGFGLIMIPRLW